MPLTKVTYSMIDGAPINVLDYGADNTGATSSVAAVEAAITYANSLTVPVLIDFPAGVYDLTAGISVPIERGQVSFNGNGSKILCESGKIFNFIKAATTLYYNNVENFWFDYPVVTGSPAVPTDVNAIPVVYNKGSYFGIYNLIIRNAPAAISLENCSNFAISNVKGNTINVAKSAILINGSTLTSVGYFENISLYNLVSLQPDDPADPFPDPPVNGNVFFRITGNVDTMKFGNNVLSNRYHRGLYILCDSGKAVINIWATGLVLDICYDRGLYILNNGGSIANLHFNSPYINARGATGLADGIGVDVNHNATTGLTQEIKLIDPIVVLCGISSIRFFSKTSTICIYDCLIQNASIAGGNRLAIGGYDINVKWARVNVVGGEVGKPSSLAGSSYACQATYGIYYDGCDVYFVEGLRSGGSVGSYVFTNNPASLYLQRRVNNNRVLSGYSVLDRPEYTATPVLVAPITSPDTYQNTTPYRQQVNIFSAGAAGAATITVNGVLCSNTTEFGLILEPGGTMVTTTAVTCNRRVLTMP